MGAAAARQRYLWAKGGGILGKFSEELGKISQMTSQLAKEPRGHEKCQEKGVGQRGVGGASLLVILVGGGMF